MPAVAIFGLCANAQMRIDLPLPDDDHALLDSNTTRKDFRCHVKPLQPFPGFDLRLHSGFEVGFPSRVLSGQSGFLYSVFRVTPLDHPGKAVYLYKWLAADSNLKRGNPAHGTFDAGPGRYRVDWLLRDTRKRVCTAHWTVHFKPRQVHGVELGLAPGAIEPSANDLFDSEPAVPRRHPGLHALIMVNMAPQQDGGTVMDQQDLAALALMLRDLAREPRFASFSLTAFQLNEMRVIFRQRNGNQIDFPAMGKALEGRFRGTVNIRQLIHKDGREEFLKNLIARTLRSQEKPDVLIFIGLKAMLKGRLVLDAAQVPQPGYPVVYLNYNTDPVNNPWQDAIGDAVKFCGGRIYTISSPSDLWSAWPSVLEVAESRQPRHPEWSGASQ